MRGSKGRTEIIMITEKRKKKMKMEWKGKEKTKQKTKISDRFCIQ